LRRRSAVMAAMGLGAALGSRPASAQVPVPPVGELKSLGQDRYQLGRILLDKRGRSFSVPGRVHALDKPLEYLATAPGGMKAYETLFEVDTFGTEFNLACILIGLERDPKQVPWQRFSEPKIKLTGQRVLIDVAWTENGKRRQMSAAQAVLNPGTDVKPESVEWVYTGAPVSEGMPRFTPDDTGTLIGFIHDVNCIIDSVETIGIGAYGSIRGNPMLPPEGSPIELVIRAAATPK